MTSMSRGATYVAECAEVQVLNHAFLQINHRLLRGRCNHWPTQQWLPDWCYLCPSRIWSTPRLWPQSGGHLCVLRSFVAPRVKIPHPPRHSRRGCRRPLSHCRNSCCAGYDGMAGFRRVKIAVKKRILENGLKSDSMESYQYIQLCQRTWFWVCACK